MTAKNAKKTLVEQKRVPDGKQATTKNWLTRRLRRSASRQGKDSEDTVEIGRQASLRRPQTAPSGPVRPTVFPATLEPPLTRPLNRPPPRPPRPDSGVIRDVNAWLDASTIKPAPTLMAGLPYWREGAFIGSGLSSDVRYAVPIVQAPETERPSTAHSEHIKSFCRRAKRMQVRMPTLLRTKSQRVTVVLQKGTNRRSNSTPLLSQLNEMRAAVTAVPQFTIRTGSVMYSTPRLTVTTTSEYNGGWLGMGQRHFLDPPQRFGSPVLVRLGECGRKWNTMRPSTAVDYMPRENSVGNLSDAPTYFSGPPPPAYRSQAASIVTTSSFGCIDGMNSEQRRQPREGQRSRGVKDKIKRFAQKAHFTK
ncbi:hypothetical protein K505DRAFT_391482 [Melanomma pulvis-pyrius CBS 109.77]|uniref:Uncharacterized protein n=1 Tax=Melanomma pulvis-pyrius CBS 109.77 TaxID=1314802 RepID=A0A6A6X2C0_9PLEO|nr:hypothetical protein K505DRAFT_391482 [Melanomma pulvis-pyrius CBS 109.77]